MAQKITQALLIFLVLIFPFGELARFQLANDIAVTLNDVIVGIVAIASLILLFLEKRQKQIFSLAIAKPLTIFVGICFLSLLLNANSLTLNELIASFLYLLRFIAYALLFPIIFFSTFQFKKLFIKCMIFVGFIIVLIGYLQYFFYPNLRNLYYLGWDEHLYRMFSSFLDPNFAGAFFVLYFLLITALFFQSFKKNSLQTFLYGLLSIATFIAIFLTYSRSALVMLVVGSLSFLLLIHKKKLIIGFLLLFFLFIIFSPKAFKTEGTNLLRTASTESRFESAQKAIAIIQKNPLIGVGFNTYRYAQSRYFPSENSIYPDHAGAGTDNSFLFIFATTGIFGLIVYIYLLYRLLQRAFVLTKSNDQFKSLIAIIFISSIFAIIVNSFFINSLFYVFILEWIFILYGLMENK